jgi:phosphatidate cytidylyltransferase
VSTEVLRFCLGAFALGATGMYAANRRVNAVRRRERWIKFIIYFVILNTVLLLAARGPVVFGCFASVLLIAGASELVVAFSAAPQTAFSLRCLVWSGYGMAGAGLLLFSFSSPSERITFVYLVVAVFDGFSQVAGQLFGKHRLARTISPSKTVEGATGGAFAAVATALLLRHFIGGGPSMALGACAVIVAAALAGDLAASWVKRRCRIKDFGHLLPQHGGVLDRFDSFLFAAPASLILLHARL